MMRAAFALALLLVLAGCQKADETPAPAASEAQASDAAPPPETAIGADTLDKSALAERKQPEKLLAYLAIAIGAGRWDDAALAWPHGEMTGAKVKTLFGNPRTPLLTFGKGRQEGAAGSLYYEAPILLLVDGASKEGTITLRRVNDVPGAEDWQLAWHVERLEWTN